MICLCLKDNPSFVLSSNNRIQDSSVTKPETNKICLELTKKPATSALGYRTGTLPVRRDFEPATSGLTCRRSTNWAASPLLTVSLFCQYLCSGAPVRSHTTICDLLRRNERKVAHHHFEIRQEIVDFRRGCRFWDFGWFLIVVHILFYGLPNFGFNQTIINEDLQTICCMFCFAK